MNLDNKHNNANMPWIERYRPTKFDDIVLDPINKKIFENILKKEYFSNLLFYGPPGTGKTTTIINLINEYQKKNGHNNKGSVIHLNASDERGIDIIRNQINQFVKSNSIFETKNKFVILDEVDYMTKNAQQALKYLLQTSTFNVRFCLICNYISKIDESLQNEFICIRFNQLPKKDIFTFIHSIAKKENIFISNQIIETLQNIYKSDIRSMINYIQLNQNVLNCNNYIIHQEIWEKLHDSLLDPFKKNDEVYHFINDISIQYNMDKINILQSYFNYVIRNHSDRVTTQYLNIIETIIHNNEMNIEYIIKYFTIFIKKYYFDNHSIEKIIPLKMENNKKLKQSKEI
jgi:replication factor C subunit 3/5